jgi:hypothetical protein
MCLPKGFVVFAQNREGFKPVVFFHESVHLHISTRILQPDLVVCYVITTYIYCLGVTFEVYHFRRAKLSLIPAVRHVLAAIEGYASKHCCSVGRVKQSLHLCRPLLQ